MGAGLAWKQRGILRLQAGEAQAALEAVSCHVTVADLSEALQP